MVFRTAINYLSHAGSQLFSQSNEQHPLIGKNLEIGGRNFLIRSLLAEGGFALVFSVQDVKTGEWFALKKQLAVDRIAADAIVQEIKFLKQLSGHPSIIRFIHATQINHDKSSHRQQQHAEFLILTELCTGGPLIDYIRNDDLTAEQICKIFHAISTAVQHLHDRNPPITHRDIKIENLLFNSAGFIKLCDFGSSTTDIYRPTEDWNASMRVQLEEEMAKFTTPMYRAPEILNTYHNYPIGPPQDVWALGCVFYYLCYKSHPFEDSAKLRILNAKYTLPEESAFKIFHNLIRQTLQSDPYSRPTIRDICEQIEDIAMALNINLSEPVIKPEQLNSIIQQETQTSNFLTDQPTRALFDQGLNFIKIIKEKSTVTNISEQLKTQLRFDPTFTKGTSREKATRNSSPITLPTIETQVTQLTCEQSVDSTKKEYENFRISKANQPKTTQNKCPEVTNSFESNKQATTPVDFFNSLNWNSAQKNETCKNIAVNVHDEWPKNEIEKSSAFQSESQSLFSHDLSDEHLIKAGSSNDVDLLNLSKQETCIQRNKSAPNFNSATKQNETEDIFTEFLTASKNNIQTSQKNSYQKPDYSRKNFAQVRSTVTKQSAFDDLLTAHGFVTTSGNKTLSDLIKEQDSRELDPISCKIKFWTDGKQRNIRALLGSLSNILWDEANRNWTQPTVAELFEPDKIKKYYRKACLVVHPDKQTGTANEQLARAIFVELNDAFNEFSKSNNV